MNPSSAARGRRNVARLATLAILVLAAAGGAPTPGQDAGQPAEAGRSALARGDFETAAGLFAASAARHGAAGHTHQEVADLERLAEAQRGLGDYEGAALTLRRALETVASDEDPARTAHLLADLGDVQLATSPTEAEATLRRADALAEAADLQALRAVIANNLGNHHSFGGDLARALNAYSRSAELVAGQELPALEARALANAARAAAGLERPDEALRDTRRAAAISLDLPASHEQAVLLVNVARSYADLAPDFPDADPHLRLRALALLRRADRVCNEIGDVRTRSYALGYIGSLYADEERFDEAQAYTSRALFLAQQAGAPELLYRWHWQQGRLARDAGHREEALASLRRALAVLEPLRPQLQGGYGPARAAFRDGAGRLYSELVSLLLLDARQEQDPARSDTLLREARDTMERLKAAELRDYFRDECVDALEARTTGVDEASLTAAVIYPVSLPDRLEILLTLPGGVMKSYVQDVPAARFSEEIHRFRKLLKKRTTREYMNGARRLYSWLIDPIAEEVESAGVDTLVFVPDGALMTVPMSALHDGERFLVERFPVAITPSLRLTDPRPIDREQLRPLLVGLSRAVEDQAPLPYVPDELAGIHALFGGKILLDDDFDLDGFDEALQKAPYNVVHIATHGVFDERVEDSYLYTADGRMSMDRLGRAVSVFRYRDTPLELLTLSACETAQGTDRAALGLAGMAVKAGARSVLGTLWSVQDAAAAVLVIDFYAGLAKPGMSRAAALANAQRAFLADPRLAHPSYWSAFVLISSWL